MSSPRKKKRRFLVRKKRTLDPTLVVNYKNSDVLKRFVTDRGKIIPRRISGATSEQQRKITTAVKRARYLGLLPYCAAHRHERGFAGEMQMVAQTFSTSGFRGRRDFRNDRDSKPRSYGNRDESNNSDSPKPADKQEG